MNSNYVSSDFFKKSLYQRIFCDKNFENKNFLKKKKLKSILKNYSHWSTVSLLELWDLTRIQNPC